MICEIRRSEQRYIIAICTPYSACAITMWRCSTHTPRLMSRFGAKEYYGDALDNSLTLCKNPRVGEVAPKDRAA
jgi:hypothetical protein